MFRPGVKLDCYAPRNYPKGAPSDRHPQEPTRINPKRTWQNSHLSRSRLLPEQLNSNRVVFPIYGYAVLRPLKREHRTIGKHLATLRYLCRPGLRNHQSETPRPNGMNLRSGESGTNAVEACSATTQSRDDQHQPRRPALFFRFVSIYTSRQSKTAGGVDFGANNAPSIHEEKGRSTKCSNVPGCSRLA